jgi:hypothetical protein
VADALFPRGNFILRFFDSLFIRLQAGRVQIVTETDDALIDEGLIIDWGHEASLFGKNGWTTLTGGERLVIF